jgi:hypothetical protein
MVVAVPQVMVAAEAGHCAKHNASKAIADAKIFRQEIKRELVLINILGVESVNREGLGFIRGFFTVLVNTTEIRLKFWVLQFSVGNNLTLHHTTKFANHEFSG